ncbi:MAG: acyl-CoA carboxylase subunit beta [Acidobacteria bacterium]|nr:MAG: acyl-CoA carboxylase subunit beta [Acidobacteriota bacterium]
MSTKFNRQTDHTPTTSLRDLARKITDQEAVLRQGGGPAGQERQRRLGRLTARERLDLLLDRDARFFELGLWAGYRMYDQWGGLPAAGVVAGIGQVSGQPVMVIANDATVKAGAMFPQSIKKVLRAQRIAYECRLPTIYLVDSSGVFLPLQDEIFPDEDDFGRIFRNNAIFSAAGIPQIAAVMGNCIAGGAYLPVLCDKLLMTQGSGLYLAGPALVKAAIGQNADAEELGGARMHAEISGTVDFHEPDDQACLARLRRLVELLPEDRGEAGAAAKAPRRDPEAVYELVSPDGRREYDVRDVLATIVDRESIEESRPLFGQTLVTCYASIEGRRVGIVANQRKRVRTAQGALEIGGVIYTESADKAARFVMDCNQLKVPILFIQDVLGFMVGREAEQSGIIRSGAKLVNAVSNSIVPKITLVLGNSFGAGNYALCGKAYDPNFILAWPGARYAVMGADQAAQTLSSIKNRSAAKKGSDSGQEDSSQAYEETKARYEEQMDIRYGAARGWVDAIIQPHETRTILGFLLAVVERCPLRAPTFHTGVLQV